MATILVVDDRPTNRELLVTLLGYASHRVLEAAEGEAGLAIARAEHPDLIITDIVMPTMDGYEFARQVRADPTISETQIIFHTSSYIVTETRRLAEACGVHTVLTKPIEPQVLLDTVQTALESTQKPVTAAATSDDFYHEHMRLLTDTLAKKVEELEAESVERKQAEAARLESEARYHRVLDAMMEGCQIIDFDWRYVYVNDVVVAQGKQTREEMLNHTMMEVYPGIENTELFAVLRECMEQRTTRRMENQFAFPDGSIGWFELSIQPAREGIFVLSTDITERKRAEEAVRERERTLKLFVDHAPAAIAMFDRNMKYIAASRQYLADYHLGDRNIIGYSHYEIFPEVPERWKEIHRRCLAGATEKAEEDPFPRADGNLDWVRWEIHPWYEKTGEIGGIILFSEVITERKQAEERFRLVVESAPNAILAVNRQGLIEMVNSQAERFFGYDRAELIGLNVDSLVPQRLRGVHRSHRLSYLEELASRSMGVGRDLHGVRKDGTEFPVEIGLTPITTDEGLLVIATIVDITQRKQAEQILQTKNGEIKAMSQQLWQAAKLATMGELAASIAHELNNPLAIVSLRAEMLQSQFTAEDPQSKSLLIIAAEVKRMSSLVMNLLQFSRRSSSQISTINVNEEVADTLELVQYHLRKNNILTVQELSPELPMVQVDRQQLRQVFLNLFTNAADAMPLGGMLIIRTWSAEKPDAGITAPLQSSTVPSLALPVSEAPQMFIEVSDTGEGIPADRLEKVWEPFYTTKPEGKGTGLGLAICRRIIQEHGGTIEVFSEGIPGKGTTVRLSLPAVKER